MISELDLSQFIITENISIIKAMDVINKNSKGIVFVCDDKGIVLASLTDGDIREHILSGKSMTAMVSEAANYHCHTITVASNYHDALKLCDYFSINAVPRVDANGKLVSIFFKDQSLIHKKLNIPVVIMAGGKGTRLYPYTKILPKSLIPIGDLTISEHIMNIFLEYGCHDFTMIVNHKKEMIKAYFSDNKTKSVTVGFLEEEKFLGTGGGLSLLRSKVAEPFFFTNCDILLLEDYGAIYDHHKTSGNMLTMICATKTFSFPYGTVDIGEYGNIRSLLEKPSYSFLTNTGFYIIEPAFLDLVPDNTFIHITDIIQNCIEKGCKIGIYPVSEDQWFDMGNHEDMKRMKEKLQVLS
jgi:dTDP-glucose pyrophosphorylase